MEGGGLKNSKLQKIRSLQKRQSERLIIILSRHIQIQYSKLKILNLDDAYKLSVRTFKHGYFNDNLPSSFQNMFKSLAEPNRTKSYKLERVLNKNLESFLTPN